MTQVTSGAFTVQIIDGTQGPFAGWLNGQVTKIISGTPYNYDGSANEPPQRILGFSGGVIASSLGKWLLFGGGDNDYWGNEVWELDVDAVGTYYNANGAAKAGAGSWTKQYTASTWARYIAGNSDPYLATCDANSDPIAYPGAWSDGNPISRHSYNSMRWLPSVSRMFVGGGSYYGGSGGGGVGGPLWGGSAYARGYGRAWGDMWMYDPSGKTWESVGVPFTYPGWDGATYTAPYSGIPNVARVAVSGKYMTTVLGVSPTAGCVGGYKAVIDTNEMAGLVTFNTTTKLFAVLPSSAPPVVRAFHALVLDPVRDVIVCFLWNYGQSMSVYEYSLVSQNGWATRTTTGTQPALSTTSDVMNQIAFSTYSNSYVMPCHNDQSLWRLDPSTWAWTKVANSCFPGMTSGLAFDWCSQRNVGFVTYMTTSDIRVDVYAVRA